MDQCSYLHYHEPDHPRYLYNFIVVISKDCTSEVNLARYIIPMAFTSAFVSCKKLMDDRNRTELDTRKSPNFNKNIKTASSWFWESKDWTGTTQRNSESRFSCAGRWLAWHEPSKTMNVIVKTWNNHVLFLNGDLKIKSLTVVWLLKRSLIEILNNSWSQFPERW